MNTDRRAWQPVRGPHSRGRVRESRAANGAGNSSLLVMLQRRYRAALSGAVVAKARYLAQSGEAFATAISVERAHWRWQRIEGCRSRLAAEISKLTHGLDFAQHPEQHELRV